MDIFIIMNKIEQYTQQLTEWIKANPGKATIIAIFIAGLIIGAVLF
jgi:hypothetical protein